MTTIYGIWSGDEIVYFPSKVAALREARLWAGSMFKNDSVDVTAYTVAKLPKRDLYCRLLNGHWAEDGKIVASIQGKRDYEE